MNTKSSGPRLYELISWLSLVLVVSWLSAPVEAARNFRKALPGYKFQFPQDHRSHNEFKTEWWYYTGHLKADDGNDYGFELTFFRSSPELEGGVEDSPWSIDNLYMAHFAVTDINKKRFFYEERLSRPGVDTAGADTTRMKVWNRSWSAELKGDKYLLKAITPEYSLELELGSVKPPVVHGKEGVSQKASCVGCASHYYSLTRLTGRGALKIKDRLLDVTAKAWMDHEFGSNQLTKDQVGWDWFSIQLNDGSELMLYLMRLANGKFDPNSSGTVVSQDGKSRHLAIADFSIRSKSTWTSPVTGGRYPADWTISIPSEQLELSLRPLVSDQELAGRQKGGVSYWEGACSVQGTRGKERITGQSYVEMTGYAAAFNKRI